MSFFEQHPSRHRSIVTPVDMLVLLLLQPARPRDEVRADLEAARERRRRER
jgi:hypothetical protein